jgi:VanZ family protein
VRPLAEKLTGIAGWLAVFTIVVLSLLPGSERPHTGASGHIEHIAAYLITAALLTFGYKGRRVWAIVIVSLTALSGLMEILQIFIPGRHAGFDDFAISSLGSAVGAALIWGYLTYLRRMR